MSDLLQEICFNNDSFEVMGDGPWTLKRSVVLRNDLPWGNLETIFKKLEKHFYYPIINSYEFYVHEAKFVLYSESIYDIESLCKVSTVFGRKNILWEWKPDDVTGYSQVFIASIHGLPNGKDVVIDGPVGTFYTELPDHKKAK